MSEDLREDVARAVESAIGRGEDPDEIESVLDDMRDRVDAVRAFREGGR